MSCFCRRGSRSRNIGTSTTTSSTSTMAPTSRLRARFLSCRSSSEMEILATYLPKSLSLDEIVQALAPVKAEIKAAGNDGQATGIAMKQLKSTGAIVNGKDVGAAIKELRKS